MGWRWRQYIRIGPLKYVLSRSGVGVSIGVPGLRYGVTAAGRRFVSVGIPGLGLYWYRYLGSPSRAGKSPQTGMPARPIQTPLPSARRNGWARAPVSPQPGLPWWKQKNLDD